MISNHDETARLKRKYNFEFFPDDIFIVSYPKSGNTWFRFILGNYLTRNTCTFLNVHKVIPGIHINPEDCQAIERPRYIKSHSPFRSAYPKVVYIIRDGRDVAVSYYFHLLRYKLIASDTPFEDYLIDFNAGLLDKYGSWSDHIHSWLDNIHPQTSLIIKYEDMKADVEREFTRFLEFADISPEPERVTAAIQASNFEKMKELEQAIPRHTFDVDRSIPFVRKGEVGGWSAYFHGDMLEAFLDAHGSALERLGYIPPSPDSEPRSFRRYQFEQARSRLHEQLQKSEARMTKMRENKKYLLEKLKAARATHTALLTEVQDTKKKLARHKRLLRLGNNTVDTSLRIRLKKWLLSLRGEHQ